MATVIRFYRMQWNVQPCVSLHLKIACALVDVPSMHFGDGGGVWIKMEKNELESGRFKNLLVYSRKKWLRNVEIIWRIEINHTLGEDLQAI